MIVVEVIAGMLVVAIVLLLVPYSLSVWRLPSGRRPLTPKYDRLGRRLGEEENPDYLETEPEEERKGAHGRGREGGA